MNKPLIIILLLLLPGLKTAFAQVHDFQSWHELELEKEVTKAFSVVVGQEFRFANNSTYLEDWITIVGAGYKINKYLRARLCYRYDQGFDPESGLESAHRLYGDVIGKYKLDRFTFSLRERYQATFVNYSDNILGDEPLHYLRTKIAVGYNIKKSDFSPNASIELFHSLNNPMGNATDKIRLAAGIDYEVNKNLKLGLFYQVQIARVSYRKPANDYILGTSIGYSF